MDHVQPQGLPAVRASDLESGTGWYTGTVCESIGLVAAEGRKKEKVLSISADLGQGRDACAAERGRIACL